MRLYDNHRSTRSQRWTGMAVFALILAVFTLGGWLDVDQADVPTSDAVGYEAGWQAASDELTPRIAAAYAQGQRDALKALQDRPEGLQVAQTCAAWSAR